jgi:hypothetical protein
MKIYCCDCGKKVSARLTDGKEVYPHRKDLCKLPFWKCDSCGNFVGCHHKTGNRTAPLGVIPSQEIKEIRKEIHTIIDPLWQEMDIDRSDIYSKISDKLGYEYHTANIRTAKEGEKILSIVNELCRQDFTSNSMKRLTSYAMLGSAFLGD